jgi:hypothetical protein
MARGGLGHRPGELSHRLADAGEGALESRRCRLQGEDVVIAFVVDLGDVDELQIPDALLQLDEALFELATPVVGDSGEVYCTVQNDSSDAIRESMASNCSCWASSESLNRFSHLVSKSSNRINNSSNMVRVFGSMTPLARWSQV